MKIALTLKKLSHLNIGDYLAIVLCVFVLYTISPHRFASRYTYIPQDGIVAKLLPLTNEQKNFSAQSAIAQQCDIAAVIAENQQIPLDTEWHDKVLHPDAIEVGGEYMPPCIPKYSVAVIVPYRNREHHLEVFLNFFHNYLQKQQIHYRIFVVEQHDLGPFNRGKLFNIGSQYAARFGFPCLVLHDVDLIPMNLGNVFACTAVPRHMSSSLDSFRFNLPYPELFGGAITITLENFKNVNGFSNMFKGWGGEDDDFYERIVHKHYGICRFPPEFSRYTMLKHTKEVPSKDRNELLRSGYLRYDTDGLNSLRFEQKALISRPLFTHILVDV